jgi:oligosaccharide repeat unit polymerase
MHSYYFEEKLYTELAYLCIALGVLFFAFGFWLFTKLYINYTLPNYHPKTQRLIIQGYNHRILIKVMRIFTRIEIIKVLYHVILIIYVIAGSWSNFFGNNTHIRFLYLSHNPGLVQNIFIFMCNATTMIGFVFLGICLAKKTVNARTTMVLWTILEVIFALVTMSKLSYIMYIIVVGISYLNNLGSVRKQKKMFIKLLPYIIMIVISFLFFIGIQRNYGEQGLLSTVIKERVIDYLVGPTEALGHLLVDKEQRLGWGANTFSFISGILQNLGFVNYHVTTPHTGYVDIGRTTTNVFTWFRPFYLDFSYIGFIIGPFFIGSITGILYNQENHNIFIDVCNAWISAILAMSFFDYLWSQSIYIFIIIYAYIIHRLLTRRL